MEYLMTQKFRKLWLIWKRICEKYFFKRLCQIWEKISEKIFQKIVVLIFIYFLS